MKPPRDDLYGVFDKSLPRLLEKDVLLVTSKVVSIHQGRCIEGGKVPDKLSLVKRESDYYLRYQKNKHRGYNLTIKDHTLVSASGIDRSNGNGYFILWPRNVNRIARDFCAYLKKKHHIRKLAVIIIDSHSLPMRFGSTGIAIGFFGIEPLRNYIGSKDIFGRRFEVSRTNIVDSLAALSGLVMGEGREKTPLVIARDVPNITFSTRPTFHKLVMPLKDDMFYPLLKVFKKK